MTAPPTSRKRSSPRKPNSSRHRLLHVPIASARLRHFEALTLPPGMRNDNFDLESAFSVLVNKRLKLTLVPARCGGDWDDRFEHPRPWLVVTDGLFGSQQARELELSATRNPDLLYVQMLRSSGRAIADGTLSRRRGNYRIDLRLSMGAFGRLSVEKQPLIVGELRTDRQWRFQASSLLVALP